MLGSFRLMCSGAPEIFSLIQEMSRKTPPCGLPRTAGALVALGVPPTLLFVVGGLALVEFGNVVEHEPEAQVVAKDPALAANTLGHQDAAHARRPDHSRRVELEVLHVDEIGARVVREGLPVAGGLPAVARA